MYLIQSVHSLRNQCGGKSVGGLNDLYNIFTSQQPIVVLTIRTWAIWGCRARIGFGLGILLSAIKIPIVITAIRFIRSLGDEGK